MIYYTRQDVIQMILDIRNNKRIEYRERGIEAEKAFQDIIFTALEYVDKLDKYHASTAKKIN